MDMTQANDVLREIDSLDAKELDLWVERGWVRPRDNGDGMRFSDADVARVRLIAECRYELEIDTEAMPVVLSLLDQVHGLRRELFALTRAVAAQPEPVRDDIVDAAMRGIRHQDP